MCAMRPKYLDIYSVLKEDIKQGIYPVGSFLPTENELVEKYSVSKTTVRHAVKLLRDNHLIEVKQGSGTRVLPMEQESVTSSKYNGKGPGSAVSVWYSSGGEGQVKNTKAAVDRIPADEKIASALKIPVGSDVYRLQRLQSVDSIPFGYMVNYLSAESVPNLDEKGDLTIDLYGHLKRTYDISIENIEETVDAAVAGFMEAQYLRVDVGTPLIVLRRIAYSDTASVEYCETTVRPDVFHMTVKFSPILPADN